MHIYSQNIEFPKAIWSSIFVRLKINPPACFLHLYHIHVFRIVSIRLGRKHWLLLFHSLEFDLYTRFPSGCFLVSEEKIVGPVIDEADSLPVLQACQGVPFEDSLSNDSSNTTFG